VEGTKGLTGYVGVPGRIYSDRTDIIRDAAAKIRGKQQVTGSAAGRS
jgi:hypothetical protein